MELTEWPDWMSLPYDWWDEEELNRWLKTYQAYVECQRLKEEKRRMDNLVRE